MGGYEDYCKGPYEKCLNSFWWVLACAMAIAACLLIGGLALFFPTTHTHVPKVLGFACFLAAYLGAAGITVHAHHMLQELKAARVTFFMATGRKM